MLTGCGDEPETGPSVPGFRIPREPPQAHYTIRFAADTAAQTLTIGETIRLTNTTAESITHLAFDRAWDPENPMEVSMAGQDLSVLEDYADNVGVSPTVYKLPEPLDPGDQAELEVRLVRKGDVNDEIARNNPLILTRWYPELWWGHEQHNTFDVKVDVPPGYVVATSGVLNQETGYYHAERVRSFGIIIGKDLYTMEDRAGDVLVRALYREEGTPCARLLVSTAVDVIEFYRRRFGFYPYPILAIIPGMDYPAGGYPVATNIVAVHGQERMDDRPELHWRWITAHEIGHEYWYEYVLSEDFEHYGRLMIGLGVYTDRAYVLARDLGTAKHRNMMQRYIRGVREHVNTTIERPPEAIEDADFDFNNVVKHGKGYSVISALGVTLGDSVMHRVMLRCLKEYGGRRLSARDFQRICEAEARQDLDWFFTQWLRTNRYLSYEITGQQTSKQNDQYLTQVKVSRLGTLKMPVPVVAEFQDGTRQTRCTNRFLDTSLVRFTSSIPPVRVSIDPDSTLPLIVPPPSATEAELRRNVRVMAWTGAGKQALDLFQQARELSLAEPDAWFKLGLTLYDGKYYQEALDAFQRTAEFVAGDSSWRSWTAVWQGHIQDILGNRELALRHYREALRLYTGSTMTHSQYDMHIDREWIERRLQEPFQR